MGNSFHKALSLYNFGNSRGISIKGDDEKLEVEEEDYLLGVFPLSIVCKDRKTNDKWLSTFVYGRQKEKKNEILGGFRHGWFFCGSFLRS